jgi:hypothetical protein
VIVIGTMTLIAGLVMRHVILERVGAGLLALGLVLLILAYLGRPVGNRNWY